MDVCYTLLPSGKTCGKLARWRGSRNPFWPWQRAWWRWERGVNAQIAGRQRSLRCWRHR